MRTIQETRFECLKLANILATTKIIGRYDVLTTAESYYEWVTKDLRDTLVATAALERATEHYRNQGQALDPFEVMKRTY